MPKGLDLGGMTRVPNNLPIELYKELLPLFMAVNTLNTELSALVGAVNLSAAEVQAATLAATARLGSMFIGALPVSEAVAAGDLLNIYNSGGAYARKASKAAGTKKPARAVALEAGASGATIKVCFGFHLLTGSFTPGTELYLGVAGAVATTKTLVVGEVSQSVGIAVSSAQALIYFGAPFAVYARNPQSTATGSLMQDETGATLYGSGPISGTTKYYEPILVPL